jgi:hypothetical protein
MHHCEYFHWQMLLCSTPKPQQQAPGYTLLLLLLLLLLN